MSSTTQIQDWSAPETGIRPRPDSRASYYYVRVQQSFSSEEPGEAGEIGRSSPILVNWTTEAELPQ